MRHRRKRSKTYSWHMTGPSSWPTHGAASQKNSVVALLVPASRSRTVEQCTGQQQKWQREC